MFLEFNCVFLGTLHYLSQMMADTQAAINYTYIKEDPKQYMAVLELLQPSVMPKPPAMPTDSRKARALQPGLRGFEA